MSDFGTIKVRRKLSFAAGRMRRLDVLVDGQTVGKVDNGKEESFAVAPGRHTVQVKSIDGSEILDVNVSPNDTVELECDLSWRYWLRSLPMLIGAVVMGYLFFTRQFPQRPQGWAAYVIMVILFVITLGIKGGAYYLKRVSGVVAER